MKKIFFGMMALVAMVATSCQQDVDLDQQVNLGETATVSFNLATPQIATKAKFSEGALATHLQYAVYDANQNILDTFTVTDGVINSGSTQVEFQLTTGNTYYVLFWAAAPNAPYTVNLAAKTMEVSYNNAVSSDENRDAFYYYDDFTVEAGMAPISAELKRPFAQLNIGTSDLTASANAGYTVTQAKVTVPVYTKLNFASGDATDPQTVTFDYANVPTSYEFPVAGYEYLAMNYLLMNTTKETVDVKFQYTNGTTAQAERTVGSVPVQRNHRTNLYGQLLTSDANVNVEIKPEYDGEDKYGVENGQVYVRVDSAEEFNAFFADSKVDIIILNNDVTLSEVVTRAEDPALKVASGKTLVLDLNGKTLSATSTQTGKNYDMIDVRGTLTVKNGTIEYKHVGENMRWGASTNIFNITAGGVVNIEGVTAKNLGGSDMGFVAHLNNWGECTLNVENSTLESNYIAVRAFNSGYDMNNISIKNSTLKGKYCFWVHNYKAAGDSSGTDETLNLDILNGTNSFVYTGKAPILYGFANPIYYDVDGTVLVSNTDELNAALKTYTCVKAKEGDYTLTTFPAGAKIIGSGENTVINATSIITVNGAVTIENAHIVMSNDGYKGFQGGVELNLKNCTIEGQPFLYGTKATFEGCTFEQAAKGNYNVWAYAVKEASFTNCVFNCDGRCVLIYQEGPELVQNVAFEGCTFNAATPAGDGKAAVEIGASNLTTGLYTVAINNCTSNGFDAGSVSGSTLWNVKNGNRANVTVDGEVAYLAGAELVSNGLWKSGSTYSVTNAEGLATLNSILVADKIGVNASIVLLADIDFAGKTWTPVRSHIDWNNTVNLFNGNGHTIKNLTINGKAMFTIFANNHDVVVKDITFDNAKVNTSDINAAIIVGQTYNNLLLENVDVKNSTIVGSYKVAALVGTVYDEKDSTITATLKGCDVANTTVKSTGYDFCTAGLVSFVYADNNDKIVFENCSVSDVKLYGPTTYGYKAHAAIYTTGSETLFNEAEGVTVTNVTFENI